MDELLTTRNTGIANPYEWLHKVDTIKIQHDSVTTDRVDLSDHIPMVHHSTSVDLIAVQLCEQDDASQIIIMVGQVTWLDLL